MAPENGWLELISFWDGLFSGAMLVSGSVPLADVQFSECHNLSVAGLFDLFERFLHPRLPPLTVPFHQK